jgi:hypothetical protein
VREIRQPGLKRAEAAGKPAPPLLDRILRDDPHPAPRSKRGRASSTSDAIQRRSAWERIDLVGGDGNDASGLDREIDRPIVLLAGDADQVVVQSVVFTLLGLGPAAFG